MSVDIENRAASDWAFIRIPELTAECPHSVVYGSGPFSLSRAPIHGQGCFYAPDFSLNDPCPWIIPETFQLDTSNNPSSAASLASLRWTQLDKHVVENDVREVLALIESYGWHKVVPVWFSSAQGVLRARDLAEIRTRVLGCPPVLFPYGFAHHDEGMIGASPELLFRIDKEGLVHTTAVAGTQDASPGTNPDDLLSSEKDRHEHQLVVDFIADRLRSLGSVSIAQTVVRDLGRLRHLFTPLVLTPTSTPSFEELVELLHPTPALGALPQEPGLHWLREKVGARRRRHGAPFGVLMPDGQAFCLVAIRNLQWNGDKLLIGAGCGIVKGSDPETEYREATGKIAAIQSLLGF